MEFCRKDLANYENLELAWKRIQTSTGYDYKKISGDALSAFGWNFEQNLKCLQSEITEKIYKPNKTSKYYLPKKSNLVRPITVLSIKDQIYYQAIVNLISEHNLSNISQFRKSQVFGGLNVDESNSIFYLSDWRKEYSLYKESIKSSYEDGYKWLVKFDLASFYDVIDHKILIEVSSHNALDADLKNDFFEALQIWTQPQAVNFSHSHGIPQGPVASQVLADIYLHFLDTKIIRLGFSNDFRYFRYVDDIVLLTRAEKAAKENLVKLDIAARELALVPQSGKISVKEIKDIKAVLKGENSIFDFLQHDAFVEEDDELQASLMKLLLNSVKIASDNEGLEIVDDTGIKYSLNRLTCNSKASAIAMKIVKAYPYLAEVCVSYFSRCQIDQSSSEELLNCIKEEPIHDWHTAKLMSLGERLDESSRNQLFNVAVSLLQNPHKHWILKQQAAKLIASKEGTYTLIIKSLELTWGIEKSFLSELPHCLTLFKIALELDFHSAMRVIEDKVVNSFFLPDDFCLFLGFYASFSGQNLPNILNKTSWVTNNLFLGDGNLIDGISFNLVELYNLNEELKYKIDFRDYLGLDEYQAALDLLVKARGFFERDPNMYFAHTDSFNQIVLSCVHTRDGANIPKHELGNMITKLKNQIPYAFSGFDKCHNLRCEVPEIHAYSESKKSLNVSSSSRFREREKLKLLLASSYEVLLEYIESNHICKLLKAI